MNQSVTTDTAGFGRTVADYFKAWFRYHPEAAVEAGVHGYAQLLTPYGDDERGALVSLNDALIDALDELDGQALTDDRQGGRKCRKRRSSFSANVYLTSGHDNLALHRVAADPAPDDRQGWRKCRKRRSSLPADRQRLDHIGFIVQRSEQVDDWFTFLTANDVPVVNAPRTHRDGARSLYCRDPDGNTVQLIYHPPLSGH